jgi:RNA polymerase sigma-54 factor
MQNSPATYHSLGESLLSQIALIELNARQRAMLEFLVFSLDARGYLPRPLALLVEECGIEGASADEFSLLLEELRHATHPALGASDLCECLLLQVDGMAEDHALLRRLITENLADVAANRLPHIARATGHSLADVGQAIELLRTLDPCPGSAYGEAPAEVIRPELVVEEIDGTFQVRLTREGTPELMLSAEYTKLLREAPRGDSVRKWVKQRLGSARWFIDAIAQRQSTLLRIGRAIFERQAAFLEKGEKALHPLRMVEVADATGVHISTVSRAVAGKYAQTPHGILPLRSFFSGGTARAAGGVASQKSIQQRLKELVAEEDASDPLSDDRLAECLYERDGIRLAPHDHEVPQGHGHLFLAPAACLLTAALRGRLRGGLAISRRPALRRRARTRVSRESGIRRRARSNCCRVTDHEYQALRRKLELHHDRGRPAGRVRRERPHRQGSRHPQ